MSRKLSTTATILACGACPITAASDLLKPGGYSRMLQWLENSDLEKSWLWGNIFSILLKILQKSLFQ